METSIVLTPIEKVFVYVSRTLIEIAEVGGKHPSAVRYEIYVDGSGGLIFESDGTVSNEVLRLSEKKFGSVRWSRYDNVWVLVVLKDTLFKLALESVGVKEINTKQEKV